MLIWLSGSMPPVCAATVMPARVWVCITQCSVRPAGDGSRMDTKPAGLTGQQVGCRLALGIDLDQRAGGDLLEQQPVGIDQEAVALPRHADREMGKTMSVMPKSGDQPIGGGEILPQLTLARDVVGGGGGGSDDGRWFYGGSSLSERGCSLE